MIHKNSKDIRVKLPLYCSSTSQCLVYCSSFSSLHTLDTCRELNKIPWLWMPVYSAISTVCTVLAELSVTHCYNTCVKVHNVSERRSNSNRHNNNNNNSSRTLCHFNIPIIDPFRALIWNKLQTIEPTSRNKTLKSRVKE